METLEEIVLKKYRDDLRNYEFLFGKMGKNGVFTWLSQDDGGVLDYMYLQHSGKKNAVLIEYATEYIKTICDVTTICDEELICGYTEDIFNMFYKQCILKFSNKWNSLYNSMLIQQTNLLNNEDYEMVDTPDLTTTTNADASVNTFAFNSTTATPTGTGDNNQTITQDGTRTITYKGRRGVNIPDTILKQIELLQTNLYEQMMMDVDTIITLPKYSY